MIFYDMPYDEYRSHPSLGSTDLKNILKSPAHFREARNNPSKSTNAMSLGTAVHAYLLERDTFFETYAVEPESLRHVPKNRNPYKAEWDAFKAAHQDRIIIDGDDWDAIKGIRDAIYAHPYARAIMERSKCEVSTIHGELKARADLLSDTVIADIKTCQNANNLVPNIQEFMYYMQNAMYTDLFEQADGRLRQFVWIACETTAPYCVKLAVASDAMIERGRFEYKAAREIYRRCVDTNDWPGYDTSIQELDFKPWFKGVLG